MSFADSADPAGSAPLEGSSRGLVTAIMAATVCYSVLGIPLQVTDSLVPMLDAQRISSVVAAFSRRRHRRPVISVRCARGADPGAPRALDTVITFSRSKVFRRRW